MKLAPEICYRAVLSRDARYDGRFFTCVKTTGIYCRPVCPARPPKRENCEFVPTAAAAQEKGFRPCLRCRPESSPDLDAWRGTSATVSRALKLIEGGALDADDVDSLAEQVGVGERQLRRLFKQHLGASPVTVAQTRRLLLAKQLIHQTDLPMIDVALASGFGSVRRFNEAFQQLYDRAPNELRQRKVATSSPEISLLVPYRPPYDWGTMIRFLQARAIVGMELVEQDRYSRVIEIGGAVGTIAVSDEPEHSALRVNVQFPKLNDLPTILTRVRRMFDLSADPAAIAAVLSTDSRLAPLVLAKPGLRVPGAWDGFEVAVRAVLGQQITVKAATTLAGRIVSAIGSKVEEGIASPGLTHAFPRLDEFTTDKLSGLGITTARISAMVAIAKKVRAQPHLLEPGRDLSETISELHSIPGIGEWTAQYIAMRALGESDAFLAGDIAIQKRISADGSRMKESAALAHSERWRPWRAYAVLHLWMADESTIKSTRVNHHAISA